jgi:hypothetical protein
VPTNVVFVFHSGDIGETQPDKSKGGRMKENKPVRRVLWSVLRIVYGFFFIVVGVSIASSRLAGWPPPLVQANAQAQAFMDALGAAHFMDPLVAASYLAGGICLMRLRWAPLGLVILAPPVSVILAFHLVLSGTPLVGITCFAVWALLAWHFRDVLQRLWVPISDERLVR